MKQLSIYEDLERYNDYSYSNDSTSAEASSISTPTAKQEVLATPSTDGVEANVTEIIIAKDKADNVQMLLPMLTHLNQDKRWLAWIDPPMQLLKQWREKTNGLMRSISSLQMSLFFV